MCDVDEEAVVSAPDAPSIYEIPKVLHAEGLDAYVVRRLRLPFRDVDWTEWDDAAAPGAPPRPAITIALVGKYIDLPDAYLSPAEALRAGGFGNDAKVTIRWVTSDDCENPEDAAGQLEGVDGILIPGGFGVRGIEGKIGAIRHAREHNIPILGLCLGLQCMVIEVARDLAGLADANSAEFDPGTPTRSSPPWPTRRTWSRGSGTWAARCASASTRPRSRPARSWASSTTARP